MKRIFSLCLVALCIVGFVACNRGQSSSGLGDSLDSPTFSLDGVVYTLPVHFSELEANGWRPYDTDPRSGSVYRFAIDTLDPGDSVGWELILGDQNVIVGLANLSEEVLPLSESYVVDISVLFEIYDAQLILSGDIMLGSTFEEVIIAYGEPSSWHDFEDRILLFYSSDYFGLQITVDTESNLVMVMTIRYLGG